MTGDQSLGEVCGGYEGIYTLTPEGNLKGEGSRTMLMSFDKAKNQIVVSGGAQLEYLTKFADIDGAKRTMAGMRSMASAWEALATDYKSYNPGPGRLGPSSGLSASQRLAELRSQICPVYGQTAHFWERDGWGDEFLVFTDDAPPGQAQEYVIVSAGSDGQFDRDWSEFFASDAGKAPSQKLKALGGGPTKDLTRDIVYSGGAPTFSRGAFAQYPEGALTATSK